MTILFSPKNIFFITKYSLSKKGRLTPRAAFLLFMKMNYVFVKIIAKLGIEGIYRWKN